MSPRTYSYALCVLLLAAFALAAPPAFAAPALTRVTTPSLRLRPTGTAPRMTVRQLGTLGIDVFRTSKGKLLARPNQSFRSAEARQNGLIKINTATPHLRYIGMPDTSPGKANTKLYPRKRRSIASSFKAPTKGRIKIAFLDADSTLRVSKSGAPSPNTTKDVALLPNVAKKVKELARQGYFIAVVSNQGGIARGMITDKIAEGALRTTARLLSKAGAPVHYFDYAGGKTENRKPNTMMGERLAGKLRASFGKQIDWRRSIMVGDAGHKRGVDTRADGRPGTDFSNSDRGFAQNMAKRFSRKGMKYHHPRNFFGWAQHGVDNFRTFRQLGDYLAAHPQ